MVFGSEQFLRGMWEFFTLKRAWARKILADAAQEKQEGKQGRWPQETPFKEVLEASQKKCGHRLRSPDNAPCVQRNEAWQLDKVFKGECKKAGKLCE